MFVSEQALYGGDLLLNAQSHSLGEMLLLARGLVLSALQSRLQGQALLLPHLFHKQKRLLLVIPL